MFIENDVAGWGWLCKKSLLLLVTPPFYVTFINSHPHHFSHTLSLLPAIILTTSSGAFLQKRKASNKKR
jgi:hypothetical protein